MHEYWTVLDEAEREQWDHVPLRAVGPLAFGMSRQDAVARMSEQGFTADPAPCVRWNAARGQWRVDFRRGAERWRQMAVTCYFVEGVGLTCVLVDGLRGPQVTFEGMRLIGRVPSELDREIETYLELHDLDLRYSSTADVSGNDCGFERGAQRAGDVVVSWAVFANPEGIAYTLYDVIPREVWLHR
ncbi:hypothetical protein [Streptomyces lavendulae]|uniref:hypothetical protein n=1 Tax=Streptomyces lavendulae TaxID=1914 RepID=UPI0033E2A00F